APADAGRSPPPSTRRRPRSLTIGASMEAFYHSRVRVSAKADYAIRAMVELAASDGGPLKAERIAQAQEIPLKFLENIMTDLRQGGLVRSQRGADGGYWLARPAEEITLAHVIRTVEGPLANVRGPPPG